MANYFTVKTKTGESYKIQIMVGGSRKTITIGKMSKKAAELIYNRVETINSCNLTGYPYPPDVAQWLGTIGDELHTKLSKVGLVEARQSRTLMTFLEGYQQERTDWKPATLKAFNTARNKLIDYFGDVHLRSISSEQAALYRSYLVGQGYATAFVAKLIMQARSYFNVAKRRKLIDDNPFREVETGSQVNKDREHYVTETETRLLLDACPNAKARLIIALGRYAGLRIPSELRGLRWSEINWADGRFIVHSPKTEGKGKGKGKSKRVVPIFGELRPYLEDAFELAPEGEDRIFPEIGEKKSMGSWIHKLADRAGVELWDKPFQNMRKTCATDLNDRFPSKVCAEWLGHTEQIADKHYRMVTDEHFQRAAQIGCTENRGNDITPLNTTQGQESCAAESVAAHAGNTLQISEAANKKAVNCSVLQPTANACEIENGRTWSRTKDLVVISDAL